MATPSSLPAPFVFPNFDFGLGRAKKGVDYNRENYVLGTLGVTQLFSVASIGASVVSSTVQAYCPLPCRTKIPKIVVFFSAIAGIGGDHLFNIVLGTASYQTSEVSASQFATVGGTWATNDTATTVINGHSVVATITQGSPTLANVAADIAAAINADATSGPLVEAIAGATTVTVVWRVPGTGGNGITFTVSKSSTSGTYVANGATLSGGVQEGVPTIPGNDNSSVPNVTLPDSTSQIPVTISGGAGICTNPAVAGNAMFTPDVPINTTNFPNLTAATGTGPTYGQILVPNNPDAVWPNSGILTLRVTTPAAGSISNLIVYAVSEPGPLSATYPSIPGALTQIPGIPVPNQDF